ncbi:hypothetical protein TrVE_jg249 [Triparma verrucosa]|uniref:Uncharacterized protein n=1 Tax=Triparma verrucosa TaxID=1606542 RepID=A0A9W7FNG7_9STRA|nr:hypothetical protein TrVE_jg249 [Triparma verrucosa]
MSDPLKRKAHEERVKNIKPPERPRPQRNRKYKWETHNSTIFVSIASYRDPEINTTLEELYKYASHPDLIYTVVHFQESEEFLAHGPSEYLPPNLASNKNIKLIPGRYEDAAGAGASRSLIQQEYNGEDYYLQLDSHHRFSQGWDFNLITKLEGLKGGCKKPFLSQYLNNFKPDWDREKVEREFANGKTMRLTAKFFSESDLNPRRFDEGYVPYVDWDPLPLKTRYGPTPAMKASMTLRSNIPPQRGAFFSGHFVFADGKFVEEVPYDPNVPFDGEEDTMSIRAFTHGWDLHYCVDKPVILHMYGPRNGPAVWDDKSKDEWWRINQRGMLRLREMLVNANGTHNLDSDGEYGLGKERSLGAFEEFSGVEYEGRLLRSIAKTGDVENKGGFVHDDGNLERYLWVAENRKIAFQKVAGAWWQQHIDPYNQHGLKEGRHYESGKMFLEVTPPDWTGNERGAAKDRIGANVVLFDPKDVTKQLRLSQRRFEVREITQWTSAGERNETINGHKGWTNWNTIEEGMFY